jgi:tetratricopeptide (TPR) repeat protein
MALLALGEIEKSLGHLREAAALAEALGDRDRLARISVHTAVHFWQMGQPDDAVATGRRAVVLARETDDLPLQAEAGRVLGIGYHVLGDYGQAIEWLERSRDSLQDNQIDEFGVVTVLPAVGLRAWLVWCLAEIGRFAGAIEHAWEALRLAEAANHASSLVFGNRAVGARPPPPGGARPGDPGTRKGC